MFTLTIAESIIVFLVMTLGSLIQSVVGFGAGLLAVPILLLIDPVLVPGPMLTVSLVLSLLIYFRNQTSIDFTGLGFAAIGRVPGSILGVWVLVLLPPKPLSVFIGLLVFLAVGLSLAGARLSPTRTNLFFAGILSGFMGSTTSIGGPPIALIYQRSEAERLRGTLAGYFILGAIIALVALFFGGRFGWTELIASVYLLPGIIAGYVVSIWLAGRVNQKYLRPAVLLFSALSATSVIVKSLL